MHRKISIFNFQKTIFVAVVFTVACAIAFFVGNYQTAEAWFLDRGDVFSFNNEKYLTDDINSNTQINELSLQDWVSCSVDESNQLVCSLDGTENKDVFTPATLKDDNYKFDHWILSFYLSLIIGEDVFVHNDSSSVRGDIYEGGWTHNKTYLAPAYSDKISTVSDTGLGTFSQPYDYIYLYDIGIGYILSEGSRPDVNTTVTCVEESDGTYSIKFVNNFYQNNPKVDSEASFTFTPTNSNADIWFELYDNNGGYLGKVNYSLHNTLNLTKETPMVIKPTLKDNGLNGLNITKNGVDAVLNEDYVVTDFVSNTFYLKTDGCTISNATPSSPVPMHLYMDENYKDIKDITFSNLNIAAEKEKCEEFVYLYGLQDNLQITFNGTNTFDCLNFDMDEEDMFEFAFAQKDRELTLYGEPESKFIYRGMNNAYSFYLDGSSLQDNDGNYTGGTLTVSGDLDCDLRCQKGCHFQVDTESELDDGQAVLNVKDNVKIDAYSTTDDCFYFYNDTVNIQDNARVDLDCENACGIDMNNEKEGNRSKLNILDNANFTSIGPTDSSNCAGGEFYSVDLYVNTTGNVYFDGRAYSALYLT